MKNNPWIGSVLLLLLNLAFLIGCTVEIKEGTDDYDLTIYRWYSQDYEKLQQTSGNWFLYFDDELTRKTCKLDILSKIRQDSNLWLITRFDSNAQLDAFKKAYKLENQILNLPPDQKNYLNIPFIFQMEGTTMKNLIKLDDDALNKGEWNQFFSKSH